MSFHTMPRNQYGIIFFDFILLHTAITLLYGGMVDPSEQVINRMGKFGIRIATKLSEICLGALQQSIQEHLKINVNLSDLSPHLYSFCNQDKLIQFLNFSLTVSYESVSALLNIVVPGNVFDEKLDALNVQESEPTDIPVEPEHALNQLFDSELRDSVVDVAVSLPEMKLRAQDVLDLKSGDIIPIGDPATVFISLDHKKLFKGIAGKVGTARVAKIISKV